MRPLLGRPSRVGAALIIATGIIVGCTDNGSERVTVLGASSLTAVLADIEADYEAENPEVDLVVSTAGSPTLAAQAAEGAPASVLLTADDASMQRAVEADVVAGSPRVIATNRVTVAVPAIESLDRVVPADLERSDLVVVLCLPEVPCGAAAADLMTSLGVTPTPDSLESSVQAVVTKLRLGEADAGIVYRTDVAASTGALRGVDDRAADEVGSVTYLAASLTGGPGGDDLLDFLTSADGRRLFDQHGFGPP
jgi:molybdate transport system substrate-binding protein